MPNNLKPQGNSWTWISNFPDAVNAICKGSRPQSPLHVEIHPHHNSTIMCNNHCAGCTGLKYASKQNQSTGINPERLIETIDSFKRRVKKVVFSGCCIEPLLYPQINEVYSHCRKARLDISLYSNFYYANKPGIIETLASPQENEYVRISLNSGTKKAYNLVHHPIDKNSFEIIQENIKDLLSLKKSKNPFVHLTYLLSTHNCDKKNLESAINFAASNAGIDSIRFSVYQKPLGREMPSSIAIPLEKLDEARKNLEKLKSEYTRKDFSVEITNEEIIPEQKKKPFNKCRVQDAFAVIGFDGNVYPCTAMASTSSPDYYKFGNINTQNFWDIWKTKNSDFHLDKCYDCTRAEFQINSRFHEEIKNKNTPLEITDESGFSAGAGFPISTEHAQIE